MIFNPIIKRNLIRLAAGGLFLALATGMPGTSAGAITLGTAQDYNAFVFGSFTAQNSDIQGRLAVGGSASFSNYSVGSGLGNDASGLQNSLVVGGGLSYYQGEIQNGDTVVGGSATGNVTVRDGQLYTGTTPPINFDQERAFLEDLSVQLSTMDATGTVKNEYGGTYLTTDSNSMLQVFNVNGDALSNTNTFKFLDPPKMPNNATLVFNVSGETNFLKNFDMQDFKNALGESYDNVLFNFYETEALEMSGISFKGSILAPLASVTASNGNIEGTIIANTWNGPMELHNVLFDGDTPASAPVPEPGTLALFSLGILGFAGLARRRFKE